MPRTRKVLLPSPDTPFAELPTLAVERLANALSKQAELLYQRMFGLHLSECRVLGIVSSHEPTSLSEVCEQLELDKGHVSRLVSKLVATGLLDRSLDLKDQRSAYLVVTPEGRDLASRIRSAAAARNREWMAELGKEESAAFITAVTRMTDRARAMLALDAAQTGTVAPSALKNDRQSAASAARAERPLVVERPVLEEMRRQLDQLLARPDATP